MQFFQSNAARGVVHWLGTVLLPIGKLTPADSLSNRGEPLHRAQPWRGWIVLGLLAGAALTVSAQQPATNGSRPSTWAVKLDKPGLPNLHCISSNLFRGAQPTKEGMAELKKMGIKTVIDLRAFHSDEKKLQGTALEAERFKVKTWHAEDEDVVRFLKLATDTNNYPIFFHCEHGADRTGVMCAMYRVAVCGWSRDEAIREMTEGGYGFHPVWKNLVTYVKNVDVEKLKRAAGIEPKAARH